MLTLYTIFLFVAVSQCRIILLDDVCVMRCAEELPDTRAKAMVICMDLCKQSKRSHEIAAEDFNEEPKMFHSATHILSFIKEVINSLIMLSKRVPLSDEKLNEKVAFLESNDNSLRSVFRKKRDAEFTANLAGKANVDSITDFSLDTSGLTGSTKGELNYQGEGKGTGRLSAGAINLQGDWEGDIGGKGQLQGAGKLSGLDSGFKGGWTHEGEGKLGGKATANIYGLTVGGGGGQVQGKYSGEGAVIGGVGKGGLVGVEYEAINQGELVGSGGAGIGHPMVGIGAGIHAEGKATGDSQIKGGLGVNYGPNGLGLQSKTQTHSNVGGQLDLTGGIGSYEKYAEEQSWKGR